MFGRILTIVTLGAMITLLLLFQSTSPSTIGPGGIFAAFFLLYVIFVGVFTWSIRLLSVVSNVVSLPFTSRVRASTPLSMSYAYYYGSVLAIAPLMVVGMASVGAIGFYEVLLVIAFEIVALFYVKKRLR